MEHFESLIYQAICVRDAVVDAGGMATKSFMEDYLVFHHPDLSRGDAHDVTNTIEFEQRTLTYDDKPTLNEYPEVVLQQGKIGRAMIKSK